MLKEPYEIRRQILHILFGFFLVYIYGNYTITSHYLLVLFFVSCTISYITLYKKIPLFYNFLHFFERKKHLERFPGKGFIFFVCGAYLVLTFWERSIALAAIMILTLGDSFSNLVGYYYGKKDHFLNKKKTLEGSLGGILAAIGGASVFVSIVPALFSSIIALTLEAMKWKVGRWDIDDNLIIPVVAASVIEGMTRMGWV